MNKLLLDTNIYSHALRGNPAVIPVLRRAEALTLSAITVGELLSGFRGGQRERENRAELADFLDSPRVKTVSIDEETAEFYAAILDQLRRREQPIPTNDIWIAAAAMQHGLTLYSFDAHFQKIEGLLLL
ncbi:MAG TPA: type II toxin-antitoxin system VapC family toxin [Desulfurivibrio alkaliphilus]|uniref:Ribonuclease VapC n=1 Tax=Desulfurivibrio alkaliphilus TaxID=427923 RepID=A0A7C2XVS4_9BACT|nr:type II toxin-antitoxin system VapC family toxin [Desulfurivibrio alkaliphilus]